MNIQTIQERVRSGQYLVKSHAILHAVKEGFDRQDMVDAVLNGRIIEAYPERDRVLICGLTSLSSSTAIYLHVVCECDDPIYVEFISAYIPDEIVWENPPYRRRKSGKR